MKLFIKLLILLLILACAAPFFLKGPNGRPLINLDKYKLPDLLIPSIDDFKNTLGLSSSDGNKATVVKKGAIQVYKWRDERGVVHYSDRQDSGQKAKLTQIKGITILPTNQTTQVPKLPEKNTVNLPGLTTVPLGEISKLIKDAKQVEQLLQDRKLRQDAIIDGAR